MSLSHLQPSRLWAHFQTIARIPHPSGQELVLRDYWRDWALQKGWQAELDAGGNLIIRKPATPGMENRLGVILQAHLDMVSQKNTGHPHDFAHDPLQVLEENGWVHACGTTLGADNGIGVAAALAVLDDESVQHGPLEVLLTLDEEAGMTGARTLESGRLQGQLLFNLDTEEWGEVYVGCAGGVDVTVQQALTSAALIEGWSSHTLALTGLKGGHSGCDIHLGRANAVSLLVRALQQLRNTVNLRLVSFEAGTVRNAIAREAFAIVAIPASQQEILTHELAALARCFNAEFSGVEGEIHLLSQSANTTITLTEAAGAQALNLLQALPYGVHRFSQAVPGVVETSNNLGVVRITPQNLEAILLVRSLIASGMDEVVGKIQAVCALAGATAEAANAYPGWQPDLASRALHVVRQAYRDEFHIDPAIKVIHAGLECGLIGAQYPHVEMVSFGPTIRDAHSPAEKVEVASVAHFWDLLKASLAAIPEA